MAHVEYIVDERAIQRLTGIFDDAHSIVMTVVESAVTQSSNNALSNAANYPRPSIHPFVWSFDPAAQDRARRWYFAAIARGEIPTNGTRYQRSGNFGRSFDVGVEDTNDSIDAVYGSDFDKASYVVGESDNRLTQIPGHQTTGWYQFADNANHFVDDVAKTVKSKLPNVIKRRLR